MNNILIFNKHTELDPLFIWQLTKVLSEVDGSAICRSWKNGPHIKVVFDNDISVPQLREVRDRIEKSLYAMGSNIMRHIEITLHVDCREDEGVESVVVSSFNDNPVLKRLGKEMRNTLQETLTDVYFYLKINDISNKFAVPVLIHYISRVVNKRNQSLYSTKMHQRFTEDDSMMEGVYDTHSFYLNQFENEHHALLRMWYRKWDEMFIVMEHHIKAEVEQQHIDLDSREYLVDNKQGKITALTAETMASLLYDSLPFLYVHPIENEKYMYLANAFSKEKAMTNLIDIL